MERKSWVERARKAAGITQVAAGEITGMSNITFGKKEKNPELFTIGEFFALRGEMDPESRALMDNELDERRNQ